jgi:hypothetical protein
MQSTGYSPTNGYKPSQEGVNEDWHDMAIRDHLKKFDFENNESLITMITSAMNVMLLLHNTHKRVNHHQVKTMMPLILEMVRNNSDTYATTFQARSVLYLAGIGTAIVLIGNGWAGAEIGKTVTDMMSTGKSAQEVANAIASMQAYQTIFQAVKSFFDVVGQQISQDLQGKRSLQEYLIRSQESMLQSIRENKSDANRKAEKHLDTVKQLTDKHFQSVGSMVR